MENTKELNKSKLGTKQYWDDFYSLERSNFEKNPNDTGECWFDDNDAEYKMVEFLKEYDGEYLIDEAKSSVIDLGTGNGHLLFELFENEFGGKLTGVDYSQESINFAKDIAKSKDIPTSSLTFHQADIFQDDWNPGKFDIVLDKGTLDAIALSGLKVGPDKNKSIVDIYSNVIDKLLPTNGVFLITSCNFTENELAEIVETDSIKLWEKLNYPVFEFGGVKGSPICTLAFVKQ